MQVATGPYGQNATDISKKVIDVADLLKSFMMPPTLFAGTIHCKWFNC